MPELSEENNNVKRLEVSDVVDIDLGLDKKSVSEPASLSPSTDDQHIPAPSSRNKKVKIDLKTSQIKSAEATEKLGSTDFVVAEEDIQAKPPVHKVSS